MNSIDMRGHFGTVIAQDEVAPGGSKDANHRGFHVFAFRQREQLGQPFLWHGEDHSFLRLTDPDFVIAQAGILQRHFFQIDRRPDFFAHFADGAGKPAGPAIGDGGK